MSSRRHKDRLAGKLPKPSSQHSKLQKHAALAVSILKVSVSRQQGWGREGQLQGLGRKEINPQRAGVWFGCARICPEEFPGRWASSEQGVGGHLLSSGPSCLLIMQTGGGTSHLELMFGGGKGDLGLEP